MSERYHNIFSYYRGPNRGGDKEQTETLENNLTKALINTLDLCSRLGTKFVEWLNIEIGKQGFGVSLDADAEKIYWGILETPDKEEVKRKEVRIMLGIKKRDSRDFSKPIEEGNPEFDGKIVGKDWLVGIESKTKGMHEEQFEQEKKWLETDKSLMLDWQQIHDFFCKLDKAQCDKAEKLLIDQLTGFLRSNGLVPFPGFEPKHFALFSEDTGQWRDNDREAFKDLMKTLRGDLCHYKYKGEEELNALYLQCDAEVKGLRRRNSPPDSVDLKYYLRKLGEPISVDIQITRNQEEEGPYLAVFASVKTEEALRRLAKYIGSHGIKILRALRSGRTRLDDYNIELLDANKDWNSLLPPGQEYCLGQMTKEQLKTLQSALLENAARKGTEFFITRYFRQEEITKPEVNEEKQVNMIAEAMITLYPFVQLATKYQRWKKIRWGLVRRASV